MTVWYPTYLLFVLFFHYKNSWLCTIKGSASALGVGLNPEYYESGARLC
jgi:hypothetical protein